MIITIEWHSDQFNVRLHSKEGAEEFLSIKGCRIANGSKGEFVSWPATKGTTGKWWSHVWGSEKFNAIVLAKALECKPSAPSRGRPAAQPEDEDSDIPFASSNFAHDMLTSKAKRMARYDF